MEFQDAMPIAFARIALRPPDAPVPNEHRPSAVLLGRDDAFELRILQRMVFNMNRQPFLAGIEAGPLGHSPAFQRPVELEPEIVVQAGRGVFLNDIDRPISRRPMARMAMMETAGGTPVESGTLEVSCSIRARFQIG